MIQSEPNKVNVSVHLFEPQHGIGPGIPVLELELKESGLSIHVGPKFLKDMRAALDALESMLAERDQ